MRLAYSAVLHPNPQKQVVSFLKKIEKVIKNLGSLISLQITLSHLYIKNL